MNIKNDNSTIRWLGLIMAALITISSTSAAVVMGFRVRELEKTVETVRLHDRLIAVIENELLHINEKLDRLIGEGSDDRHVYPNRF